MNEEADCATLPGYNLRGEERNELEDPEVAYRRAYVQATWNCIRAVREGATAVDLQAYADGPLNNWRLWGHPSRKNVPPAWQRN